MKDMTDQLNIIQKIPAELLIERPPFPKRAKIEITNRCDLKCFYCQHKKRISKNQNIDKDFLFGILRHLKGLDIDEVGLFWLGEPLLVNLLPEYVSFAKEIGINYVFITTNGRMAKSEMMKKLVDSGLDSVKFSINASSRERYKAICGVDAFDQVISNMKFTRQYRGKRKKPTIYASSAVIPTDDEEFENIHSIVNPIVDQHYRIHIYGKRKVVEELEQYSIVDTPKEEMRSLQSMLPCWALFTVPHISYDGHLSACYCDSDSKLYMGDLKRMSFMEAWHSDKFIELRRRHLNKDVTGTVCETCIAYNYSN